MHIQAIPMWSDNYAYVLSSEKTNDAVVVDPASPPEVIPALQRLAKQGLNFRGIVTTHHHHDHAGGNEEVISFIQSHGTPFPTQSVLGGEKVEAATHHPANGEVIELFGGITLTALRTPCHTQDSICYYAEDRDAIDGKGEGVKRAVFTGDTLFIAGCGRFFEGSASQMDHALNGVLSGLPDDTKVYPGHEYTKSNAKFALSVDQSEPVKKLAEFCAKNKETWGRFTIGDEKQHNPFMKVKDPAIQEVTKQTDTVQVMAMLRKMKNNA